MRQHQCCRRERQQACKPDDEVTTRGFEARNEMVCGDKSRGGSSGGAGGASRALAPPTVAGPMEPPLSLWYNFLSWIHCEKRLKLFRGGRKLPSNNYPGSKKGTTNSVAARLGWDDGAVRFTRGMCAR